MLEILKYIFSSIWVFLGTVVLLYVLGEVIINPIFVNIFRLIEMKIKLSNKKKENK